jgi:hypothetical protein
VFSIILRYNLAAEGVPLWIANLIAVVSPWLVALFFYAGNLLTPLINWSSAILFTFLNCVLPLSIYVTLKRRGQQAVSAGGGDASAVLAFAIKSLNAAPPPTPLPTAVNGSGGEGEEEGEEPITEDNTDVVHGNPEVQEFPPACSRRVDPAKLATPLFWLAVALTVACFALQVYSVTPAGQQSSS